MDAPSRKLRWLPAALLAMPVLYVLSVGPACWLTSRFDTSPHVVTVVYRPLIWIHKLAPQSVRSVAERYVNLATNDEQQRVEIADQEFAFYEVVWSSPVTWESNIVRCSMSPDGGEPPPEDLPTVIDDKLADDSAD